MLATVNAVIIYVTDRCNLSCDYCLNSKRTYAPQDMTDDILDSTLDFCRSLPQQEELKIVFFGGEPTLNWGACKRVMHALPQAEFVMQTNGLSLPHDLDDVMSAHPLFLSVSFDPNPIRHNAHRGGWSTIKKNIEAIASKYPDRLLVAHTGYPEWALTIAQDAQILYDMGVRKLRFTTIKENGYELDAWKYIVAGLSSMSEFMFAHPDFRYLNLGDFSINDRSALAASYRLYQEKINTHYCRVGVKKVWVLTNGDILPCSHMLGTPSTLGSVLHGRVNQPLYTQLAKPVACQQCLQCELRASCYFCPYISQQTRGTAFFCDTNTKNIARMRKAVFDDFYARCIREGRMSVEDNR